MGRAARSADTLQRGSVYVIVCFGADTCEVEKLNNFGGLGVLCVGWFISFFEGGGWQGVMWVV